MGVQVTEGLGAGSQPEVGRAAAEEVIDEIRDHLQGAHMVFVTAGMGGGTGTGAAPVVARCAKEAGILTVGVVTKPFHFEGVRRMRVAEAGITELHKVVDTLLIIPNQNLFRVANEKTTFADAFAMADQVLYSGVACITDLMVKEGLINLDFADVRAVMREMGKAMMGTGEASGEKRALSAAEAAIANPLIDDASMKGAKGLLISITGGKDLTLYEVDEAATRIREEVDQDANIIVGATFDESLDGIIRVSVVATGIDQAAIAQRAGGAGRRASPSSRRSCAPTSSASSARNASRRHAPRPQRRRSRRRRTRRHSPACILPHPRRRPSRRPRKRRSRPRCCRWARTRTSPSGRCSRSPRCSRRPLAAAGAGGAGAAQLHPAAARAGRPVGRRACRGSTSSRSRARTSCGPSAAKRSRASTPEKRRGGLLRRLAAVGLGRREEEEPEKCRPMSGRFDRCRGRLTVRPAPPPPTRPSGAPPAGAAWSGAGLGIRQAPAAPGARPARPAGACA